MVKTACADLIQSETQNYTDCDSVFSSDLFWKLFNDTELISCCVRISLNEEMFCTALTFNLCLHLLWSIGCQICWYHWFLCHTQARYVTLDIPLKRSHLALSLVMQSGSWTLCLSVLFRSAQSLLTVLECLSVKIKWRRCSCLLYVKENQQHFHYEDQFWLTGSESKKKNIISLEQWSWEWCICTRACPDEPG